MDSNEFRIDCTQYAYVFGQNELFSSVSHIQLILNFRNLEFAYNSTISFFFIKTDT